MKALIIVDVQNDFMPTGALPVPKGDEVVPAINAEMKNSTPFIYVTHQIE